METIYEIETISKLWSEFMVHHENDKEDVVREQVEIDHVVEPCKHDI